MHSRSKIFSIFHKSRITEQHLKIRTNHLKTVEYRPVFDFFYLYIALLGTHGHRAVIVLERATPTVTLSIRFKYGHFRGPMIVAERLTVKLPCLFYTT